MRNVFKQTHLKHISLALTFTCNRSFRGNGWGDNHKTNDLLSHVLAFFYPVSGNKNRSDVIDGKA